MNVNMLGGAHLLRYLGLDAGRFLSQLEDFHSQQLDMLSQMRDGFQFAAGFSAANQLASMLQSGMIPGAGLMMGPNMALCGCAGMYAKPFEMDFGAYDGDARGLRGLLERARTRRHGAKFERRLAKDPFFRQQVEMMLGGRIMPDGVKDGKLKIMPFPPGLMLPGGTPNPAMMGAVAFMSQIMQAASMMGPLSPFGMFNQMMLGALANVMNGGGAEGANGSGGSPYVDWADTGAHKKGEANSTQGAMGMSNNGDASAILNDSSLTVEDKVTLMIMLIMKKMDEDIEKQANYINKLQQQQNKGGKGGGKGKGGGGGKSPSIDVETMKLKRMIDKRSQMFDMLRQIIDKYNETAKNIIQSMGR